MHPQTDQESLQGETKSLLNDQTTQWYLVGRKHSFRELRADRAVLVLGAIASFPAALLLILHASAAVKAAGATNDHRLDGIIVYCFGFIFMLNASLLFHSNAGSERWAPVLLFFDKMGINLMIAGSYTPMCIKAGCWMLLKIEWGLVLFSIVWELVLFKREVASWKAIVDILRFVAAGWMILAFLPEMLPYMPTWVAWTVLAHGIIYTLATIFLQRKQMEFHFCIWHGLVLLAASMFYYVCYADLSVAPSHQ